MMWGLILVDLGNTPLHCACVWTPSHCNVVSRRPLTSTRQRLLHMHMERVIRKNAEQGDQGGLPHQDFFM